MIRLFNFTRTQEKRREEKGFFLSLRMKEIWGLYSGGRGNMNGRSFNEG